MIGIAGLLFNARAQDKTKVYSDHQNKVYLELPKGWKTLAATDRKTTLTVITPDKLSDIGEEVETGISISCIKAGQGYKHINDAQLKDMFQKMLELEGQEHHQFHLKSTALYDNQKYRGIKARADFKQTAAADDGSMMQILATHGKTMILVTMQYPTAHSDQWKPVFEHALATLVIK